MADEFSTAVDDGLRLAKRLYFGQDRAVIPPKPITQMENLPPSPSLLPNSPMVYALICDPKIVDNPDMASYQPHVHGRCDPPALLPLQMNGIQLRVECFLDTAFVTMEGSWRLHCVMASKTCDCKIAIPMGDQGSILGVEVQVDKKSHRTKLTAEDDNNAGKKIASLEDGGYLMPHLFTLTVPQIEGGSNISIKAKWTQKLLYNDGQFTLRIPYSFPEFVTPAGKKVPKTEKIQLNVDAGPLTEVLCKSTSHPLKERQREAGKLSFSYESDVLTWSKSDFIFRYAIPLSHINGGVLLQSPGMLDSDRREMFCCYIHPGEQQSRKIFKKEMIFLVDISGSMQGKPLESTKNALLSSIGKLDPQDFFNIIAFNGEVYTYSPSLEPSTTEIIAKVTEWIDTTFVLAGGSTNMFAPLNQALDMLSKSQDSIPSVILITDGAVEDERKICDNMKSKLADQKKICPRIHTFGIGTFCNHYFLRMLSVIGRGEYAAALDQDSIEERMEMLFIRVTSVVLSNISFDFDDLDDLEVYPSTIPDLSSQGHLMISGRYRGAFPPNLKVRGLLADMSSFSIDLRVQESKDILLNKVVAMQQIDILTAKAWLSEDRELKEKIAQISLQYSMVSEYTRMFLIEIAKGKSSAGSSPKQFSSKFDPQKIQESKQQKVILLQSLGVGFGDISATIDNIPPGCKTKPQASDIMAKAASDCCGKVCDFMCGMCCIRACSGLNDQCAIALAQLCGALACLGCYVCCGGK